jgi:serine/threonine protein kinase/WD40 repeat protein
VNRFDAESQSDGPVPDTLLEWVDRVADRFEASWRTTAPPRIQDYVDDSHGDRRTALVRELAKIDLERRVKAGESRSWADYVLEFPELKGTEQGAAGLERLTFPASPQGGKNNLPSAGAPVAEGKRPTIVGYKILADLGHGGMGSVYKARQESLNRVVALKVIRTAAQADPRHLARFRVEAEAAARLQNPNIVQIYEVGQQEGAPYLAMEYVPGGTLAQQLNGLPRPGSEAATVAETVARAMHYAHIHGVVHRDLKPANVLLRFPETESPGEATEEATPSQSTSRDLQSAIPKITDFGLAKFLQEGNGHTLSGAIVGTPSYMAPEQAEGKVHEVGPPADVHALGAILYEMLTGGPPFKGISVLETLEQVRTAEPVPPSRLLRHMPRDLETICLKALAQAPERRYATAGDLADDLRRFLNGEPILARPVGTSERLWRWCRRNQARAGLMVTAATLLITVLVASVWVAVISTARERDRRREGLVSQLQLVSAYAHGNGWSDEAWALTTRAASLRQDATLRGLAASACGGLDAHIAQHLERASVSSLAFDSTGQVLLLGGRNDGHGQALEGAKIWDLASNRLKVSRLAGPGPVAFHRDGTPLQLATDGGRLLIWSLTNQKSRSEFRLDELSTGQTPVALELNELGYPVMALAGEGSVAAAAVTNAGRAAVGVWSAASGRLLFQLPQRGCALAFSPGAKLLAAGDPKGQITLWSVPAGKLVATLEMGTVLVRCLSFAQDGKRLAAGDSAGVVTIWDVQARLPLAYCQGSHHDVYAIAFNPDGTLLASGGRGPARLWDAATGRLLLTLRSSGIITALGFAPDGRRLAVGSKTPAGLSLWDLEMGHGIQTLRGLTSQASHLCLSTDGKLLAAVAHNWQIGLWDVEQGELRFVLAGPQGNADDDAGLAFSPDGRSLACSAGETAKLWEVATGRELGSWTLPSGAKDFLAFHASGALLLFREEEAQPVEQAQTTHPALPVRPRVGRLRNLRSATPTQPILTLADTNRQFLSAVVTPDGSLLIVEATEQGPERQQRAVRAYDALTGSERWAIGSTQSSLSGTLALDPTGRLLALQTDNRANRGSLVEVSSGKVLSSVEPFPACLGPEGRDLIQFSTADLPAEARGYALYQSGDPSLKLRLGIDSIPSFRPVFSQDGRLLAWSNTDGSVSVCDLERVRRRLSEIGLEW